MQLDLVRLHQRVREQLFAHLLYLSARLARVVRRHLEIDDLADYLAAAREQNRATTCVVSTADDRDIALFVKAGATVVFPENVAAGLGLADQVLLLSGMTQEDAGRIITTLRAELNPELRDRVGI